MLNTNKILFLVLSIIFVASCKSFKQIERTNIVDICIDTNKIYPFYLLDVKPQFIGGEDSLESFIANNLKLTRKSMEYEGYVYINFIVNREGIVENINIACNELAPLFESSFVELFKKMPKWTPGIKKNVKVKTLYTFPFIIKLN